MLRRCNFLFKTSKQRLPVYELRVYNFETSKFDAFQQLAMRQIPKRPPVHKCQGYWNVRMGALKQMINLWRYDSLEHRNEVRRLIECDKEWQRSYIKVREDYVRDQSNMLMRLIYREGAPSTMVYHYLLQLSPHKEIELSGPSAILAATFQIIVGEHEGMYVHIVKGMNADDVIPSTPMVGCSSKIMSATRWAGSIGCMWL